MKETIYTIPINDAFDQDCACALCEIETKLDRENTEAALGAGMMEPDLRILSNEKGFCKTHYQAMMAQGQALALSLVLQRHSEHQNNQLTKALDSGTSSKGLFKKDSGAKNAAQKAVDCITPVSYTHLFCYFC